MFTFEIIPDCRMKYQKNIKGFASRKEAENYAIENGLKWAKITAVKIESETITENKD